MQKLEIRVDGMNLGYAIKMISDAIMSGKVLRLSLAEWKEKRSLSQNALQHVIYGDVSKYLISHGRTDWTPEKVKESLKNKYLGWESREFVDVETGEVKTREVLRSTAKLDKGESCHYTTQIIEWAASIGFEVRIPAKCEYRDLMERQND